MRSPLSPHYSGRLGSNMLTPADGRRDKKFVDCLGGGPKQDSGVA
jgi:hypothetical protein